MTEQRLIVDLKDIVLRLQCRCGSAVAITPAKIKKDKVVKDAIYHCSNCEEMFAKGSQLPPSLLKSFVNAIQALAEADLAECKVQFEIARPARTE